MQSNLLKRLTAGLSGLLSGAVKRPGASRFVSLLRLPPPDAVQLIRRVTLMEREIVLPIKAVGIAILLYSFYFSRSTWMGEVSDQLEIAIETTQYFFGIYIGANLIFASMLLMMHRLPIALIEWGVVTITLVDGIFVALLAMVTGGPDSFMYWLFLPMIVRSSVSVPRPTSQLTVNLTLSGCFVLASLIYTAIYETQDENVRNLMEMPSHPAELISLRLLLLLLMTFCCYATQVLLTRQSIAEEETREFSVREAQLQSAGRLAAEFAHQLKNPLGIINNAAYSLKRSLGDAKASAAAQIGIIQEEVERCDRIITQVMGYAQLSEGRVEKMNIIEELEQAIVQVFPPGTDYRAHIHRDYGPTFPPLMMHRRHLSEIFGNLLQNSREAFDGREGHIQITARCNGDYSIEVSIADDGPGIPPDKHERIFEPYFTTKARGTGLGLATVRHNVELYGGNVRLESELGKGTRFTLLFPARSHMKLAKTA
jgi:signal transduction histidine kinase